MRWLALESGLEILIYLKTDKEFYFGHSLPRRAGTPTLCQKLKTKKTLPNKKSYYLVCIHSNELICNGEIEMSYFELFIFMV